MPSSWSSRPSRVMPKLSKVIYTRQAQSTTMNKVSVGSLNATRPFSKARIGSLKRL
jgi:hypothetical protein